MRKTFTIQSALFAFLLMITGIAKAQFMCTDINPDSVVTIPSGPTTQHTLNIDVNNDNTPDFQITSVQSGTIGFIIAQTGTAWANNFMLVDGSNNLLTLNAGDPIESSSTVWHQMNSSNPAVSTIFGSFASGTWAGVNDKYIGLALTVSTNTYYGWARMSVSGSANSYTLKEYGYNSVPGASIAAGQACAPASTFAISFNLQDTICQNKSASVTANTGTVVASSYTWSSNLSGQLFSAPNGSSTNITFTSTGIYTINVAATSGTMSGSSSQTILVNPLPVIAIFSSSSIICAGSSAILTASSGATSYTWNTTANTSTISVNPSVTSTYTVIAALNGCTNPAVFTQSVITCTGLLHVNVLENEFTLFPNPVSDKLIIKSNNESQKEVEVALTDALGKIVLQQHLKFIDQESTQYLDLSHVSKGIYFVKMNLKDGESKVIRIVKE